MKSLLSFFLTLIILTVTIRAQQFNELERIQVPNWNNDDAIKVARFLFKPNELPSRIFLSNGEEINKSALGECGTPLARRFSEYLSSTNISESLSNGLKKISEPNSTLAEVTFKTANFTIYYYSSGSDLVQGYNDDNAGTITLPDGTTAKLVDGNGPPYTTSNGPDYIEKIGIYLEYSLKQFKGFTFNGGNKPTAVQKIYVTDLGCSGGSCTLGTAYPPSNLLYGGRIYIDNNIIDNFGEAGLRCTCAHELFHQFQFTYYVKEQDWITEGTAKWAEDCIFDADNFYKSKVQSFMQNTDVNLTSISYDAVLYWKYVTEQFSASNDRTEPQVGVALMRSFWDRFKTEHGTTAVNNVLQSSAGKITFNDSFTERFVLANYLKDLANPYTYSFDYIEDEQASYSHLTPTQNVTLSPGENYPYTSENVNAYAADYFVFTPSTIFGSNPININFVKGSNFGNPFVKVITIKNSVHTIQTTKTADFTFVLNNNSYDKIIVVVSASNVGGSYSLTISSPIPDLQITSASTTPTSVNPGGTTTVSYTLKNAGTGTAGASRTRFYLSTDATWSSDDIRLTEYVDESSLAGAASRNGSKVVTIPSTTSAGTKYIIVYADGDSQVSESNETNNWKATNSITIVALPDLQITTASANPTTIKRGSKTTVSYTLKNAGTGTAGASRTRFYLSVDANWSSDDIKITEYVDESSLGGGASRNGSKQVTIPTSASLGTRYIIVYADADKQVTESNEDNNTRSVQVTIQTLNLNLVGNYPNPFNPTTVIKYEIPENINVKLSVFNILGEEVITLVDAFQETGEYDICWYGNNKHGEQVSSGIYIYTLKVGDLTFSKKMFFVK